MTFTFQVRNTANAQLEITVLSDDVFGTLSSDADCHVGSVLAAGASCSFSVIEHLTGTAGSDHVNVVTATGEVGGNVVTDVDSETVLFVSGQAGGGNGGGGMAVAAETARAVAAPTTWARPSGLPRHPALPVARSPSRVWTCGSWRRSRPRCS